ncbi:MAG: ZPR1 zinc finger domain-containing protein [Candidatus Lokiarchaeota archaeon]|nr:ZPR1 zinc finger domain-containing protein [Candidatus Lokiarchaeota archaeon]
MSEKSKNDEELFSFKCPSCDKGKIKIHKTTYDVPDGDKMLLIKFECNICNFTNNDIIPLTTNNTPGIMTLRVSNEEDLKSKIYRSPVGKLEIPELELFVVPGPSADFYYTNVEGILYRFENAVSIYRKNLEKDDVQIEEIDKILHDLHRAVMGEFAFTLIVTDTEGGSYIIPEDESKYSFEKFENKELN